MEGVFVGESLLQETFTAPGSPRMGGLKLETEALEYLYDGQITFPTLLIKSNIHFFFFLLFNLYVPIHVSFPSPNFAVGACILVFTRKLSIGELQVKPRFICTD